MAIDEPLPKEAPPTHQYLSTGSTSAREIRKRNNKFSKRANIEGNGKAKGEDDLVVTPFGFTAKKAPSGLTDRALSYVFQGTSSLLHLPNFLILTSSLFHMLLQGL